MVNRKPHKKEVISIVCGTTTLAQGVNFPISNVIIESLQKGTASLSPSDFWNIAGRAGRTLVDTLGVVAFPTPDAEKYAEVEAFLRQEAEQVTSQLSQIVAAIGEIGEKFNTATVEQWPALGSLMQFLAHAMRVSGSMDLAADVEDLLRSSLVYHQARRQGAQTTRDLIKICRAYLETIRGKSNILTLADQTGFSTPSVLKLLARTATIEEFNTKENWLPERLFGQSIEPLTARVEAIAQIPEIQLGQGANAPFSAELVATILRDWVNGKNLFDLADDYWKSEETDNDKRVTEFSSYLFSTLLGRASWGLGSLQGIALAGEDVTTGDEAYISSMVFFGVQRKESVWLRMVGVPRIVAEDLGKVWKQNKGREPNSFEEIRNWVSNLDDTAWESAIPQNTDFSVPDLRELWASLSR